MIFFLSIYPWDGWINSYVIFTQANNGYAVEKAHLTKSRYMLTCQHQCQRLFAVEFKLCQSAFPSV